MSVAPGLPQSYAIRQAILTILASQFTLPGQGSIPQANFRLRMATKVTEADTLPIVIISPYGTIDDKPADFETGRDRVYRTRIAIVDGTQGDAESNDQLYAEWIELYLNAITRNDDKTARDTLPSVPGVWQITAEYIATFDDNLLRSDLIAFQNLVIKVESQEN